ncbi:MAG: hypothetical protein WAM67_13500, partial [Candidatus Acidiferrales bacterium]
MITIPIKTLISAARSIAISAALATAMACATPARQAPTQPAPAQQPPLPRNGFPAGPTAHIDSFTVSPGAIQPGQSVTLEWSVVNADRVTLDPGVGIVATRDNMMVTPRATTTYTLRVMGFGGKVADTRSVTVLVAGTTPAPAETAAAPDESLANKPVPHMPDGHPDLNGIYIAPYHSIHTIGEIRLKPGAEKYHVGPEYTFSLGEHCLPRGVPDVIGEP